VPDPKDTALHKKVLKVTGGALVGLGGLGLGGYELKEHGFLGGSAHIPATPTSSTTPQATGGSGPIIHNSGSPPTNSGSPPHAK